MKRYGKAKRVQIGHINAEVKAEQDVANSLTSDKYTLLVCARVQEGINLPGAMVIKAPCCGAEVLLSESSQKMIALSPDPAALMNKVICLQCGMKRMRGLDGFDVVTTPSQLAELEARRKES